MAKPEVYVSIDIEADGPIPGLYSMLSVGAAAFVDGQVKSVFEANLKELEGARQHPETMKFWAKNQEAWETARQTLQDPADVMPEFFLWVENLKEFGIPIPVMYPQSFDGPFISYYFHRFVGSNPFGIRGLDIKSYMMATLGLPYGAIWKRNLPKHWFDPSTPHTHKALDDALEQGKIFMHVLEQNNQLHKGNK